MMFDFYPDQLEADFYPEGQNGSFFPGDFFLQNPAMAQPLNVQQQQPVESLYAAEQRQQEQMSEQQFVKQEPSPALSGSDGKIASESSISDVTSPEASPTSDEYPSTVTHSPERQSTGEEDEDSESDSEFSDSDSDSESDEEHKGNQRPRKIPAKRRRISSASSDASEKAPAEQLAKPQPAPRKRRSKKNLPPPTDPALPNGHPLPAILGGEMPAPLRRRRRKDMTEEEMKKKEEAGIPPEEDSDSEERRMVRLPRKTLLVMTSAQIGQYIRYIRAKFNLTRGQIEELRRQKRLVKNRESAKSSRKKREALVSELQMSIAQMQSSLDSLKKDNERLANENIRLRGILKMRDPALLDSLLHDPDSAAAGKMMDADARNGSNSNNSSRPTVRVASLVFFFIVFCFALFAQVSVLQTRAGTPADIPHSMPRNTWKREMIPEVSRRASQTKPWFATHTNGRILDSASESQTNAFDGEMKAKRDSGLSCPYVLPDIKPSGFWQDSRSGLTIRRPMEWAPVNNLTYLYVAPDSFLSQAGAASRQFKESENGVISFSVVVPLDTIRPSCSNSDIKTLSRKDNVFVDVRCNIEEISIIPENTALPNDRLDD